VPETLPIDAVTTAVPAFNAVRTPKVLTVTIVLSELCHVTEVVSDCVVLSEYVPCAASCSVKPVAREPNGPVTAMDVNAAWDTEIAMLPEIEPCVAVTVTEPAFRAVNIPEALRDANVASEAFQVT